MAKLLNKKVLFIGLGAILLVITLLVIFKKDKELTCTYNGNNYEIEYNYSSKKDGNYINLNYSYEFENMDSVVDKFDSVNSYLKMLEKNTNIQTNISQDEYEIEYSISAKINDLTDNTLLPKEIRETLKFKALKEFKTYYEELNYKCESK